MTRSWVALSAVVIVAGLAVWAKGSVRTAHSEPPRPARPSDVWPASTSIAQAAPAQAPPRAATATEERSAGGDEAQLMDRLRRADPASMLALARDGNRQYPHSAAAEEREARAIDALVALDRIGEAHSEAMLFVQHHPQGPFTAHIANLMGVHPRPPGVVPEQPETRDDGR